MQNRCKVGHLVHVHVGLGARAGLVEVVEVLGVVGMVVVVVGGAISGVANCVTTSVANFVATQNLTWNTTSGK